MNDQELDNLIRGHLDAELERQIGRAGTAFEKQTRGSWRVPAYAALALAAGAAVFFILPRRTVPVVPNHLAPAPEARADAQHVEYQVAWRTVNQGTVMVDDQPMQSLRQERLDSLSWIDPLTHAPMELTIPDVQTDLVSLTSY